MAHPVAFLCFDVDTDSEAESRFKEELKTSPASLSVGASSSSAIPRGALSTDEWSIKARAPRTDWERLVQGQIGDSDLMIILVGREAASSSRIASEIVVAKSANVPFFGVYLEGLEPLPALPAGLAANRVIPWDWTQIGVAVNQLMKEGKNSVFS